jgi:hypothetical protein
MLFAQDRKTSDAEAKPPVALSIANVVYARVQHAMFAHAGYADALAVKTDPEGSHRIMLA